LIVTEKSGLTNEDITEFARLAIRLGALVAAAEKDREIAMARWPAS
jgi:hypothetical protein